MAPLLLGTAAACLAPAHAPPRRVPALEGTLHIVRNGHARFFVTDDAGATREVELSPAVLAGAGGPLALDRRRVRVFGRMGPGESLAADSVAVVAAEVRP
ncbi:MAG TPA: hypothetical protein VFS20_01855 [Longimicrobium sp.]|nr:hypothetical protein [Longimicrobium sp.]